MDQEGVARREIGKMAIAILHGWRARLTGSRFRLAMSIIVVTAISAGGYYTARYVQMLIVLSSVVGSHDFAEDSVVNRRGDKVYIRTDTSGRLQDPIKTTVRLRRVHYWFSTTLLEADSFGVQETLKWLNDDMIEVTLGFGCLAHLTRPVEQVGSIHVSYHFHNGDRTLSKGCPGAAHSSNYKSQDREEWVTRGWQDATMRRWK